MGHGTTAPLRVDCHVHTAAFSGDASATLAGYLARGRALGLSWITTAEHVDFDPRDACYGHYDAGGHRTQYERLRTQYERLRTQGNAQQAAGDAGLRTAPCEEPGVLIGVEVDYQPRYADDVRRFMEQAACDLAIGSVHYVRGEFVFGPEFLARPEREAVTAYFEEALHAVRSGLFDVLGHLDIFKRYGVQRYGPFQPDRYRDAIEALLCACVETGTGLEINTSGYRGPPGEPFPTLPVLRRYRELGGEVLTIGSDAHHVEDLGRDIDRGLDVARAAGFEAITLFIDRQPHRLPLT
ncbi:MAG: histidinol-phosphatase HisJ family protein [Anaerolineae bacterium]|nr:histidinol-phosphatase HisJ family protein [Anaerolineae bacterium]